MGIHVAVIDDGINENFFGTELVHNVEITPELEVCQRKGYDPNLLSHGTLCAQEIKLLAPDAQLSSIKILGDHSRANPLQLVRALEWCIQNRINLINLSLGTINGLDYPLLKQVVNQAYEQGIIIVAAANNLNVVTYPASLTQVIGVKYDLTGDLKPGEYIYHEHPLDGIQISSSSGSYRGGQFDPDVDQGENLEKTVGFGPSNSFAAPRITGIVHNLLTKYPGIAFEQLQHKLILGAKHLPIEPIFPYSKRIDWIERAMIFQLGTAEAISALPSTFTVIKNWHYLCSSLMEGITIIKETVEGESVVLKEVDTLVVVAQDKSIGSSVEEIQQLMNMAAGYQKNLVYIDDRYVETDLYQLINVEDFPGNLWFSSIYQWYSLNRIEGVRKTLEEIPVMVVYDLTEEYLIWMVDELRRYFLAEGYRVQGVVDTSMGVLVDLEYAPVTQVGGIDDTLNRLYYLDLVIMGFQNLTREEIRQRVVEEQVLVDVQIILEDESNQQGRRFWTDLKSEPYRLVVEKSDLQSNPDLIQKIYRQLLQLYT